VFTGIITDVGRVVSREGGRFVIACRYPAGGIAIGASIACDGCCLTAVTVEAKGGETQFAIDVSNESLSRTTLGQWRAGRRINLERSLSLGAELVAQTERPLEVDAAARPPLPKRRPR
jgi:riboflavin synthase